jgi:hypothetical protein
VATGSQCARPSAGGRPSQISGDAVYRTGAGPRVSVWLAIYRYQSDSHRVRSSFPAEPRFRGIATSLDHRQTQPPASQEKTLRAWWRRPTRPRRRQAHSDAAMEGGRDDLHGGPDLRVALRPSLPSRHRSRRSSARREALRRRPGCVAGPGALSRGVRRRTAHAVHHRPDGACSRRVTRGGPAHRPSTATTASPRRRSGRGTSRRLRRARRRATTRSAYSEPCCSRLREQWPCAPDAAGDGACVLTSRTSRGVRRRATRCTGPTAFACHRTDRWHGRIRWPAHCPRYDSAPFLAPRGPRMLDGQGPPCARPWPTALPPSRSLSPAASCGPAGSRGGGRSVLAGRPMPPRASGERLRCAWAGTSPSMQSHLAGSLTCAAASRSASAVPLAARSP